MRVVVLGSYVHAHCLAVPALPTAGASMQASDYWQDHGGKGLNLAVGMHRLGLQVCLLLAVGEDPAGRHISQLLQSEGIDTRHVVKLGAHSGFGVGLISADGQNVIAIAPGANHLLTETHLSRLENDIKLAQIVCAQFEIQQNIALAAFRLAKRYKVRTLLNPSPWQQPSPELLAVTDILILNETEALAMFELSTQNFLSLDDWCKLDLNLSWTGELIITLAERGVILFQQDQAPLHIPAWQIQQTDPTGAGDAFTAGFVHALLHQKPHPQAMLFANACGAILAGRQGVLAALPQLSTVDRFMQRNCCLHSA